MGGGAIDEAPDTSTQYLVLGDEPLDRAEAAAYGKITTDATALGIQFISLPVLLDLIGYKTDNTHRLDMVFEVSLVVCRRDCYFSNSYLHS